jgi:hypothetical protein
VNRAPRNPDLPILDEMRAGLRARIIAAEVAGPRAATIPARPIGASPPSPIHTRDRRRVGKGALRVTRRSVVIVALLCLVAGVAFAAGLSIRGGHTPRSTSPQLLGSAGEAQFFGYRDQNHLCLRLRAMRHGVSDCSGFPAAAMLTASSLRVGGNRFVVGYANAAVKHVSVRVGDRRTVVAARLPVERAAAEDAGIPAGLRWFVADLGPGGAAPARLIGTDAAGRQIGPALLDCSLAVVGRACRQAYESRAVTRLH